MNMMMIDTVYLLLFLMGVGGLLISWWHGRQEYDNGFMDAVQLHKEGRLTYDVSHNEEGDEVITIEVTTYED